MTKNAVEIDWYGGADVGLAVVPIGQPVDWAADGYRPETQIWVPEQVFEWLAAAAGQVGIGFFQGLAIQAQSRVSASACAGVLSDWTRLEELAEQTPAEGWAVAMRLIMTVVVASPHPAELLVDPA